MEKFYEAHGLYLCRVDEITEVNYKNGLSIGEYKTKYLGYTICRHSAEEKLFVDLFTGTKLHFQHDKKLSIGEYCVKTYKPLTENKYITESELQNRIKLQEEMHDKFSTHEERDVNM